MSKVSILINAPLFCGTVTTLYDCYQYLKLMGVKSNCYLICSNMKILLWIRKYLDLSDIFIVSSVPNYDFDTVITTPDYYLGNIKYRKLILFDSTQFFIKGNNFIEFIGNLPNKIILGNTYNLKYFIQDYKVYPVKIFTHRLKNSLNTEKVLRYSNVSKQRNYFDYRPFTYSSIEYERWFNINGIYYENIGKLIFEFLLLGKKVFYSNNNKSLDDGLSYYLSLFDIDDSISQELIIKEKHLLDVFSMKKDDHLLKIICD